MWISVKDRLPEHGVLVDVWQHGHGRTPDCFLWEFEDRVNGADRLTHWRRRHGCFAGWAPVTHWMERPAPPPDEDVTSRS